MRLAVRVGRDGIPSERITSGAGSGIAAAARIGKRPGNELVAVVPMILGRASEGERGTSIGWNQFPVNAPCELQHIRRAPACNQIVSRSGAVIHQAVIRSIVIVIAAAGHVVKRIMGRAVNSIPIDEGRRESNRSTRGASASAYIANVVEVGILLGKE